MGMMTVRNIPGDVHEALRLRAKNHGRSAEAEVRMILANAVEAETRIQLGDALSAIGREIGLTNEDVEALEATRHTTPAEPMSFE